MIKVATFVSAVAVFACVLGSQIGSVHADEEDDNDFTERLVSTSEECGKFTGVDYKFLGRLANPGKKDATACGNISDGLRYVCQDNSKVDSLTANLRASLSKINTVVCNYADAKAPTATVAVRGNALHVWVNIEMSDPSERARCMIANALKLKYKGDLDAKCLARK